MNKTWIVAKETYLRAVKNWSFLLMVLSPIIFILFSAGIGYISGKNTASAFESSTSDKIGLISSQKQVTASLGKQYKSYDNIAQAKKAYHKEKIKGYLEIKQENGQLHATYYSDKSLSAEEKQALQIPLNSIQQNKNVIEAKLSQKQIQSLSKQVIFNEKISSTKAKDQKEGQKFAKKAVFYVLLFGLYFIVLTYSQIISSDIAKEKGTKIMEIIFSSMPGENYFDGKIIGIIGEVITHILIYVISGLAGYYILLKTDFFTGFINQAKPFLNEIMANFWSWSLVFVILDIFLFIVYSAICGALVNKAEDANKAAQPLTILVVIGFILGITFANSPDNPLIVISSYIPFISSFTMPLRIISGDVASWKIFISAAILVIFTIVSFIAIRRFYPRLVLQTDETSFFKRIKRALQSNK